MSNDVLTGEEALAQISAHVDALAAFWRTRAIDSEHGGFRTNFDAHGRPVREDRKYLLSHARLLWTFSELGPAIGDSKFLRMARIGFEYLRDHFLDRGRGGWHWMVRNDGSVLDPTKLVYGQSFAIYALAAYGRVAGSAEALALASDSLDILLARAADTRFGGFYENFRGDWTLAPSGGGGGDRKSLDIHMHLLEALTEVVRASRDPRHELRLQEIRELLLARFIDEDHDCGGNQYALDFTPIRPIVIDKTWIAERTPTVVGAERPDSTSYGHNLEFGWLLSRANLVLGLPASTDAELIRRFAAHALEYGYDGQLGGVYREGPPRGPATDTDKEFWQNAEALPGFLDAYEVTGEQRFMDAFLRTWGFVHDHMIHPAGEWRTRVTRTGKVVDGALGNHWTAAYHTVRGKSA